MTESQKKNLSKGKRISEESAREYQKKSSEAQVRNRKEKIILAELLAERMGYKDAEDMVNNLIDRAKVSDSSFALVRDTLGQKPAEKQEIQMDARVQTVEEYLRQFDED